MLNEKIIEKIKLNLISLVRYGVDDLAWYREDALSMIDSIMLDSVGILGGDVYYLTLEDLNCDYANWSCEPFETETTEEYYLRSKVKALDYIKKYSLNPKKRIVFSITFTERF